MKKQFLILGGYGGVGRRLSRKLLEHTQADLTISGHSLEKAENFAQIVRREFPDRTIKSSWANASNRESLKSAFEDVDLVIVSTSTPDFVDKIAEAAIETDTDMIDIFVRSDVVDKLNRYRDKIIDNNRIFITQSGFHPGLPAPFIRYAKNMFDDYQTANIFMVMSSLIEKPESTYEIIHVVGETNAKILSKGVWKKSTYRDAMKIQFSDRFGTRQCYPLPMREICPLKDELGLLNMGVYSAGFNPFVDNFVFPLAILFQSIRKGLGTKYIGKLMYWGVNKFYNNISGVEFRLESKGLINGKEKKYILSAKSDDVYDFTSIAVIACLNQYLDKSISQPNLYLMGNVVDSERIIADLIKMGVQVDEKIV